MQTSNKYTVITGASSGIGYETAKAFAARGKNVIAIARRQDRLEALKSEISQINSKVDVIIRICDLSLPQEVHSLYDSLTGYDIETWVNNAGFGNYSSVAMQDLAKIETMLRLNIEALTVFSTLYVSDYKDVPGTQLINISSGGGYVIVPNAVTYCASKFYVSAFTEGLAHELKAMNAKLQAKVLAPAATQTEFGQVANNVETYNYDTIFGTYHTSQQMADFILKLYESDQSVGRIDRETFAFSLSSPVFQYAGNYAHNQKIVNE